jgi:hypothetical protein
MVAWDPVYGIDSLTTILGADLAGNFQSQYAVIAGISVETRADLSIPSGPRSYSTSIFASNIRSQVTLGRVARVALGGGTAETAAPLPTANSVQLIETNISVAGLAVRLPFNAFHLSDAKSDVSVRYEPQNVSHALVETSAALVLAVQAAGVALVCDSKAAAPATSTAPKPWSVTIISTNITVTAIAHHWSPPSQPNSTEHLTAAIGVAMHVDDFSPLYSNANGEHMYSFVSAAVTNTVPAPYADAVEAPHLMRRTSHRKSVGIAAFYGLAAINDCHVNASLDLDMGRLGQSTADSTAVLDSPSNRSWQASAIAVDSRLARVSNSHLRATLDTHNGSPVARFTGAVLDVTWPLRLPRFLVAGLRTIEGAAAVTLALPASLSALNVLLTISPAAFVAATVEAFGVLVRPWTTAIRSSINQVSVNVSVGLTRTSGTPAGAFTVTERLSSAASAVFPWFAAHTVIGMQNDIGTYATSWIAVYCRVSIELENLVFENPLSAIKFDQLTGIKANATKAHQSCVLWPTAAIRSNTIRIAAPFATAAASGAWVVNPACAPRIDFSHNAIVSPQAPPQAEAPRLQPVESCSRPKYEAAVPAR